jgi:hypothetical protein
MIHCAVIHFAMVVLGGLLRTRRGETAGNEQGGRAGRKISAAQEFFLRRHAILPNDLILSNGCDAKA